MKGVGLIFMGAFFCTPSMASTDHFSIGGSTLTVTIDPTPDPFFKKAILDWVQISARGITNYYGRFPVPVVIIHVRVDSGDAIHHGVTYGGRRIEIQVGKTTPADDFSQDWEMTHEMFHLALPLLDDDYDWMGEGLSDYLEPIARARNGALSVQGVWEQWVNGFPKGLPRRGDQGLDETHTWGRTYWGGALYWFLADFEIRKQTQNRHSLHDAVQAILDAGGDGRSEWELDRVLEVGDRATGTTVLKDLHDRMGHHPYKPDLKTIWAQLGIEATDQGLRFEDAAPLASIRKGITASR
jgi:hypothetical protein